MFMIHLLVSVMKSIMGLSFCVEFVGSVSGLWLCHCYEVLLHIASLMFFKRIFLPLFFIFLVCYYLQVYMQNNMYKKDKIIYIYIYIYIYCCVCKLRAGQVRLGMAGHL
jgi:hypothetical protein